MEATYQSKEEMEVRISHGREHNHINNLSHGPLATLKRSESRTPTQKMAPTAAVSIAVLINLSMIVSVSGETNCLASTTPGPG